VARALKIRNESTQEIGDIFFSCSGPKERRRTTHVFVIRQPIEAFEIVGAASAAVIPTKRFVNVVSRECGGGPVVPVRTRFRIHEEAIKKSEAKRKRAMIRRDILVRAIGSCG